jgi:hypothetical protein
MVFDILPMSKIIISAKEAVYKYVVHLSLKTDKRY